MAIQKPGLVLLSALLALICSACSDESTVEEKPVRPVVSIIAGGENANLQRNFPGKINASRQVDLAFQVPGRLIELPVIKGQHVKAGSPLAKLDTRDYESNLKAAQAKVLRTQAEFKRAEELVKKQLVSRSDFDKKTAERDIAAADAEKVKKALEDATLTAPFDGVIGNTFVENFEDVSAKQPILSLQGGTGYEVVINIPENSVLRISEDVRGKITSYATFDSLPDRQFPLTIKEAALEADPTTQTYEVALLMEEPGDDLTILPGMSVTVVATMPQSQTEAGISIPVTALFSNREGGKGQYIWIIQPNSMTVSLRKVAIDRIEGDRVQIIQGLQAGERVVSAGVHYLQEGDKVRLFQVDPEPIL